MSRTRKKPDERRDSILAAALEAAQACGLLHLTRADVAGRAQVAPSLVSHYFGSIEALRSAVMTHAVTTQCLPLIAQGVAMQNPIALSAPSELRLEAIATLA